MRRALLIDLDGVVREWPGDGAELDGIEGLSREVVRAALFEPELLHRAVTGEITDEQWQLEAAARLHSAHGVECASALLSARSYPGRARRDVLEVCRRARQAVPVYLVTNATTRLDDHLDQLALVEEFDRVFNSSELGVAKPDVRIFTRVCRELQLSPPDVVFVDDTEAHVEAAAAAGLRAHLFTTTAGLEEALRRASMLV